MSNISMLHVKKLCYIYPEKEGFMSEQKNRIGKKGGAREIAKQLSEIRKKPISNEVLQIVEEIGDARKKQEKKIAKSGDVEI